MPQFTVELTWVEVVWILLWWLTVFLSFHAGRQHPYRTDPEAPKEMKAPEDTQGPTKVKEINGPTKVKEINGLTEIYTCKGGVLHLSSECSYLSKGGGSSNHLVLQMLQADEHKVPLS